MLKSRKVVLVVMVLLLLAAASLTAAMMIPDADALLTKSLETLESVTDVHAVVTVNVELPEQAINGTFELWAALNVGPNGEPGMRVQLLAADEAELAGVTAVTNGVEFWLYDPNSNTVVTGVAADMAVALAAKMAQHEGEFADWAHEYEPFDPETAAIPQTPAEAVAKLLEYVTAERNGTETVAGSNAYRLRLVPIPEKMPDEARAAGGYINLWLRSSDQLPVAIEYTKGAFGSGKAMATVAEINTGFDHALFTFVIPDGATVLQAADLMAQFEESAAETAVAPDFTPLSPTYLPTAARPGEMSQIGGGFMQRYSLPDGKSFVVAQGSSFPLEAPAEASRVETVTVRGMDATLFTNEAASRTLLAWSENGVAFLVGGDLTPEEAAAIAESLQ